MLQRIVALLFALADLAERLGAMQAPVPCLVLWVMRSAEAVAWDFVMDTALANGASVTPAPRLISARHSGDSAAEAMQLAESFRALADALGHMANANFGCREIGISRLCIKLAACAESARLLAEAVFGKRQLGLIPQFAGGRWDSS